MPNKTKFAKIILLSILLSAIFLPAFFALANPDPAQERKTLEEELKRLEDEIVQYEKDITKTRQEKQTLKNKVDVLRKTISKLNLQISQSNANIKGIGYQITDTEESISQTVLKIDDSKIKLAYNLQLIHETDKQSLVEILLSEEKISKFFDNLLALEILNVKSQELLKGIKDLKVSFEDQKQVLDGEKTDLEKMVQIKALQKKESEATQRQTDYYLKLTEAEYQKQLDKKTAAEKKAAEIRTRIFELVGVPKAPSFGEALDIAKYVEGITGVSPAFLLAVITQESNLGKNVGQCYLKNSSTGEGIIISSGKAVAGVMKPSRDVSPFLEITKELGRDSYNTPVSCPMSFGYGGAMGPGQFIPSTWVLYRDKVQAVTGRAADPWSIKDAFLAAGFYLADYGAANQTYNSEWKAAMIYFSGSTNSKYRFYGDSVMNIASQYEGDIAEIGEAG
ncbi:MAG: lytic murein transglycosylase [bacterium]|nr:lytic murein transglycosylase [bacterium]